MKTIQYNIYNSSLFAFIVLLFLGSSNDTFSQVVSGQAINTSTTWTVPAGVTSVTVECWGAGASGSGGSNSVGGGGGGGGAYSRSLNIVVVPGTQYTINVGSGGAVAAKNTNGNSGGDTWFISTTTVLAKGGSFGLFSGNGGAGGVGGNATDGIGNNVRHSGGNGAAGAAVGGGGGFGAGTVVGGTAATGSTGGIATTGGGNGGNGGNGANGNPGWVPGGASGGGSGNNSIAGLGANGRVILTWSAGTPTTALTLSNPTTAVNAATVCASSVKVPIHAFNISANGTTGSGLLTNFTIVTTGTYAVSDITNFKIWWNSTNNLASATTLSTRTPVTTAGTQTFPAFSANIPAGATSYFWVTMDVAAAAVNNRTIAVSASQAAHMTTTLTKAGGPTTASGIQTLATQATPTATAGSNAAGTEITANWSASAGATSYRLDVSTVNTFASFVAGYDNRDVGNVTTYTISGLTTSTTYYYRIRAVNLCTSANSGTITYATTAGVPISTLTLENPTTAVNAATVCASSVKAPIHAFNISANGATGSGTLTNFTIVTAGNYTVSDITNFKIWWNSTNNLTTATTLSTKTPVTTAGTQTFPAFSLNIPAGATYYFWVTMDVAAGAVIGRTLTVNGSTSSHMTTTLTKAGGPTTASGAQTLSATPAAPGANAGTAATSTQITANWNASTGATSYRLDVSTVNTFASFVAGYQNLDVGNVTTRNILGLTASTTYYYRIRAVNTCGTSGYSTTITYATSAPVQNPTITLGTMPSAFASTTSTKLYYSATTDNPNQYSIVYDATALAQGFLSVTLATLPASPIRLNVPKAALLGAYNGILTVKNSITGRTSVNYAITITIIAGSIGHNESNCTSCHITHSSPGSSLTSVAGNALLCQSCHTSTGAASAKPLLNANKAIPGVSGNSHAWDVAAANPAYQAQAPAAGTEMGMRLPGGNIICSTCHNQHGGANEGPPYLRVSNTGDALCKVCHLVRDVKRFQDGTTNKGSHPVGVAYNGDGLKLKASPTSNIRVVGGKVECSSCHGLHDVQNNTLTTDGNLLRTPKGNNLCLDCHIYTGHQGFNCLDCHEVHNTVDGTIGSNIYSIKDVVNGSPVKFYAESGLNSFIDKDGINDGICEVCHTTTLQHRSNGSLPLHIDGSDKRETSCVGCHSHSTGFATPTGPVTCIGCHSTVQSGSRGGTLQIVGIGGEFSLLSKHTAIEPVAADCDACHFESAGNHPTTIMPLKNVDLVNTEWTGAINVFCIKCHDGTPPAGITFPVPTAKYNKSAITGTKHDYGTPLKNSCQLCHNDHGSAYANLLKQATNYDGCNACHKSTGDANLMSTDLWTSGGNSHAWNVNATNVPNAAVPPTNATMSARLSGANIVCSTCHDSHNNANTKFLVNPNSADEMCKDCHSARNLGRYTTNITTNKGSHPVGLTYVAGGNYVSPAPTLSKTQVGLIGGKIECSSCHSTHNATISGSLLRESMTNATCKKCHNLKPHKGFDCVDCHQSHNITNIMLVKNIVNGRPVVFNSQGIGATPTQPALKSFADGNATNGIDGICEVCHTTTAYHRNTAGMPAHNDGQKCTSCHPHSGEDPITKVVTSFPNGSCHSCHERTVTGEAQSYPLTGAHDKHSGSLYEYKCSECHFGRGTSEPTHPSATHPVGSTADVVFNPTGLARRFGLDAPVPAWNAATKTCTNVYCHSSGGSADRGTDGVIPWGGTFGPTTPTYASPIWTDKITTCTPCHKGKGNMTAPYTITTSPLSPQAHLILSYATDAPLTGLHTHTAMFDDSDSGAPGPTGSGRGAAVQCYLCHNTNNAANNGTNYQGTYGAPQKLHVDGQTYFKHARFANGGTWAPWDTYMDHCIGKGSWN